MDPEVKYYDIEKIKLKAAKRGVPSKVVSQLVDLAQKRNTISAAREGKITMEEFWKLYPKEASEYEKSDAFQKRSAKPTAEVIKLERDLQADLRNQLKDIGFQDVSTAYNKIQKTQDNKEGDLALIYSFVKMLDPGSVVREGEIALSDQAPSVAQTIAKQYSRVFQGRLLQKEVRENIKKQAKEFYKASLQDAIPVIESFKGQAESYGANPDRTLGSYKQALSDYEELQNEIQPQELQAQQQQQQPVSEDRIGEFGKNLAKGAVEALPAIGGAAGGLIGTLAAGPVGGVPLAAAGAGGGELLKQFAKGEQTNLEKARNQAAISGTIEAIFPLAGKAIAKATGPIVKGLPKKIYEGIFKEGMKQTKSAIKGAKSLGEEAMERGIKGSPEEIYQSAIGKLSELETALQKTLKSSKDMIPMKEVQKFVNPIIGELKKAGSPAADTIIARLQSIAANNPKNITLSQANAIKRVLYDEARKSYGQQGGFAIESIKSIAKGFKEAIEKRAPDVAKLNKELSVQGRMADSMLDKVARSGRNDLISLGDLVASSTPLGYAAGGIRKLMSIPNVQLSVANLLKNSGKIGQTKAAQAVGGLTKGLSQFISRTQKVDEKQ